MRRGKQHLNSETHEPPNDGADRGFEEQSSDRDAAQNAEGRKWAEHYTEYATDSSAEVPDFDVHGGTAGRNDKVQHESDNGSCYRAGDEARGRNPKDYGDSPARFTQARGPC